MTSCLRGGSLLHRQARQAADPAMDDQGTCLWTLHREGREVACIVRLVPFGIEIDIAYDGAPIVTRAFDSGDEALDWAEKTKADRRSRGWQ